MKQINFCATLNINSWHKMSKIKYKQANIMWSPVSQNGHKYYLKKNGQNYKISSCFEKMNDP